MSISLTSRNTLADRFISRSLATDIALVVFGAVLTALAAQVAIPMAPVPITGQTFAVLLVGSVLGANRGAISMGLYVVLGAIGLPVFTGAANLATKLSAGTATLGYLVGFVAAAALVGFLAQQGWDKKPHGVVGSFVLGNLAIYLFGAGWLSVVLGGVEAAIAGGVVPFLLGDLIKIALAAAVLPLAWAGVNSLKK